MIFVILFGILPNCHIFVGQNVTIMKEQIFKLALDIIFKIVADLLDNGKIDGSNTSNKSDKPSL